MRLDTAEEVRRPGIIICEGICKRLQQSDFVVADISIPNANVFYELGLAYGINHKIVLIYQDQGVKSFGKKMAAYLGTQAYPYPNLLPIKLSDFVVSKVIWRRNPIESAGIARNKVIFYEHSAAESGFVEWPTLDPNTLPSDIALTFGDHVRSNVGTAIGRINDDIKKGVATRKVIQDYFSIIEGLHRPEYIDPTKDFSHVLSQVDSSYCLIVRTGKDCHPMSYFWLGYAHARGMNVVPITVQNSEDEIPEDLAFDIRAQRHMVFVRDRPERLERELTGGLRDMIYGDFAEWSRKRFWERMLGRPGVVSIFTAALHSEDHDREMIGDWDLRAASELASFFNQHQIRATIETPIYQPEYSFVAASDGQRRINLEAYINQLQPLLKDKNCILIASPDVNPLTEFVLAYMYNVSSQQLFSHATDVANKPHAIVAVKEVSPGPKRELGRTPMRVFYREMSPEKNQKANGTMEYFRGFRSNAFEDTESVMASFHSQSESNHVSFDTFGHLAILPNPFARAGHYIIVLNGVSGPATFALTHVLTGNAESEFSAYDPSVFDPAAMSEDILNKILSAIPDSGRFKAIQCIIKVGVGASPKQPETGAEALPYDWRRILCWSLYGERENERGLKPPIQVIQSDNVSRK